MAQLRQSHDEIRKRGARVVVVGPEKAKAFVDYWESNDLPFVGVPDPEQRILDAWGQEFKLLKLGRMPAQAVVDTAGVVRFVHYGESMSDIPKTAEILSILDGLS